MKKFLKLNSKVTKFFKAHVTYNSFIHMFIGVGVGVILAPYTYDYSPWVIGGGLIVLGILSHLVALAND